VARGMLILFFYSLGLGIPFLLTSLLVAKAAASFGWVKRHFTVITVVSGLFLAVFGLLIVTGQITQLSSFFADLLDWAGITELIEGLGVG